MFPYCLQNDKMECPLNIRTIKKKFYFDSLGNIQK